MYSSQELRICLSVCIMIRLLLSGKAHLRLLAFSNANTGNYSSGDELEENSRAYLLARCITVNRFRKRRKRHLYTRFWLNSTASDCVSVR